MTPEQELRGFQVWLQGQRVMPCGTCGKRVDVGVICRDHSNSFWVLACTCGAPVVRSTPWMLPTSRELRSLVNA